MTTITLGWIIQASIWLNCEVEAPTITKSVSSYCPQFPLEDQGSEVARGLSGGKIAFAWMAIATGVVYIAFSVYALIERRREKKRGISLKSADAGSKRELRLQAMV